MTAGSGSDGGPRGLGELLATFQAWSSHDTLAAAARRADAAGDSERAVRANELLAADPAGPGPLDALAAQHELASLLQGWRWQTVTAAREQGATWPEIARATGSDPSTARADYRAQLERVEREAAASGFPMPAVEAERYRDAGAQDPPENPPDQHGHEAAEETTMRQQDHDTARDDESVAAPRPYRREPVGDHELVAGTIVLPGGLPPDEDDHDHAPVDPPDAGGAAAPRADRWGRSEGLPSSATLAAVAERLDWDGWSEDQARAWEYLDAARELADERADAAARGDRATVAVADADRTWLDEAYQDWTVPRAAATTRAREEQEPPPSTEAQGHIGPWARKTMGRGGVKGYADSDRADPRGDGPEIARRYAHALLGLDHRVLYAASREDDARPDDLRDPSDHPSGDRSHAAVVVPEPRAGESSRWWPVPDPTLPAAELSDRELIARAGRCDQAIATGSPAVRAAARADQDAAWAEAEHRAAAAGPDSVAAQVAGYLSLVRDDDQHALASEAENWRAELDALLPSPVAVEAGPDDPHWEQGDDAATWTTERSESPVGTGGEPGPETVPASVATRAPTQAELDLLFAQLDHRSARESAAADERRAQLTAWHIDDNEQDGDTHHHATVAGPVVDGAGHKPADDAGESR